MSQKIPPYQALPPAGFETEIAYRPACRQIQTRLIDRKTEHYLTLPSGEAITLATLPPMSAAQACQVLTDWGLAKSGQDAVDVPIMTPSQAQAIQPEIIPIIPATAQQTPLSTYIPWAIALALLTLKTIAIIRDHHQWSRYEQ